MWNESSLAAAPQSGSSALCIPAYHSYCFSNIPGTIAGAFGIPFRRPLPPDCWRSIGDGVSKVVFFFVDAFGWRFIERAYHEIALVRRLVDAGVVSKLSSQFPSTTAVHVTTAHTGLPIAEHGVYEWNYYEPTIDKMIAPLRFSESGAVGRRGLLRSGVQPEQILPKGAFFSTLSEHGVKPVLFQQVDYAFDPYNKVVCAGAEIVPYQSLAQGLEHLGKRIGTDGERSYYLFYWDGVDSAAHWYGPDSPECWSAITSFFNAVEESFYPAAGAAHDTLLLVSADHGVTSIDHRTTVYLDREVPDLLPHLRSLGDGRPMVPAGSSRDFFLHVIGEELESVEHLLAHHLRDRAVVVPTTTLITEGYFGPPETLCNELVSRLGNLVVLPTAGQSVYWYGDGRFAKKFLGNHGGLSSDELEIPFLATRL